MTIRIMGAELEEGAKAAGGQNAHAEGITTSASGTGAHAEGLNTTASGNYSHAEGGYSSASGVYSHASNASGIASGNFSHAEGNSTQATGAASHSEGQQTRATADYSHAEGLSSKASAMLTSAGGQYSTADGFGGWARGSLQPSNYNAARMQTAMYTLGASTTSAVATTLTMDGGAATLGTAATQNVLAIPQYGTYLFNAYVVGRRVSTTVASAGWWQTGMVARDGGTPRLVGAVTQTYAWADATIGTLSITVNTASNYLQISVTPNATTQTLWHCVLHVNELVALS